MNNKDIDKNELKHEHTEDCGCGCGHDHEDHENGFEDVETIVLTLNDESELECIVLGIYEVEDTEYIALVTIDEEQVLLYRYIEEEGEGDFTLENIDSDEEFDAASKVFFELFGDEEEDEE